MTGSRRCGACSACCTVHAIQALQKPPRTPCAHLRGGGATGCGIYADKPAECGVYQCAWLLGWGGAGDRPDKIGVILDIEPAIDGGRAIICAREVRAGALRLAGAVAVLASIATETVLILRPIDGPADVRGPRERLRSYERAAQEVLEERVRSATTPTAVKGRTP